MRMDTQLDNKVRGRNHKGHGAHEVGFLFCFFLPIAHVGKNNIPDPAGIL